MRGTPLILVLVAATAADAQQQGSIQVSTDTQILQGDRQRRGSERSLRARRPCWVCAGAVLAS